MIWDPCDDERNQGWGTEVPRGTKECGKPLDHLRGAGTSNSENVQVLVTTRSGGSSHPTSLPPGFMIPPKS